MDMCDKCKHNPNYTTTSSVDRYNAKPIQPGQNTPCRDNFHAWEKGQTICNCGKCTATFQPTGQSKDTLPVVNLWCVCGMPFTMSYDPAGITKDKALEKLMRYADKHRESCPGIPKATQALSSAKASGNDTEPLPPQPNTDSLDIAEILAYHLDGSTEQPGFTDAVEALEQLFNKYARDAVIAELMAIMNRHDDIEAKGGIPVPLLMVANRLAELKEQRAKLKEEK